MTGTSDPTLTDMFQVLVLLAIPAVILLALRYVNRREERTERRRSGGRRDHDVDHLDGLHGCVAPQTAPKNYRHQPAIGTATAAGDDGSLWLDSNLLGTQHD
jgi:hypothetical protein